MYMYTSLLINKMKASNQRVDHKTLFINVCLLPWILSLKTSRIILLVFALTKSPGQVVTQAILRIPTSGQVSLVPDIWAGNRTINFGSILLLDETYTK